jgi:uncharacterized protein
MSNKPSTTEDEYFAREDAEKKRKIALEQQKKLAQGERDELKKLHYMHCPKCGMPLHTIRFRNIDIDRCFSCQGTWMDKGELEKVAGTETGGVMKSILNIFTTKP